MTCEATSRSAGVRVEVLATAGPLQVVCTEEAGKGRPPREKLGSPGTPGPGVTPGDRQVGAEQRLRCRGRTGATAGDPELVSGGTVGQGCSWTFPWGPSSASSSSRAALPSHFPHSCFSFLISLFLFLSPSSIQEFSRFFLPSLISSFPIHTVVVFFLPYFLILFPYFFLFWNILCGGNI